MHILYTFVHIWVMIPLLQCTITSNYSCIIKLLLTNNDLIFFHFQLKIHLNCAGANILKLNPTILKVIFKSFYILILFDHLNRDVTLNLSYACTWQCKHPITWYVSLYLYFIYKDVCYLTNTALLRIWKVIVIKLAWKKCHKINAVNIRL